MGGFWRSVVILATVQVILILASQRDGRIVKRKELRKNERQYTKQMAVFAGDLYRELIKVSPGRNLIFSPYSIESALMMVNLGAGGKTKSQIRTAMKISRVRTLRDVTKNFRTRIESVPEEYVFETANTIYYQSGSNVQDDYLNICSEVVGAVPQEVDFNNPEHARSAINTWVEEKTQNKIQELLPPNSIDPLVRLALVNAVYFKADWQTKFEESDTEIAPFYGHNEAKNVKMMAMTATFKGKIQTAGQCRYKVVQLPYKGNFMSMNLVLPMYRSDAQDFARFETCVTQNLNNVTRGLLVNNVKLRLPRFRVQQNMDLKPPLRQLGINDLFDAAHANLTAMDPTGDLYISTAVHQAFIEVQEQGSEAAAASAMIGRGRSSFEPSEMDFSANHPFIYFITHVKGGVIFMGRVMDP